MPIHEVNPSEYDLLIIPGGYSPEKLRLREEAVDVARTFLDEDRVVAAVGHAAQLLLSAGAISGRSLTSAPEVRDDVRTAGGTYRDEAVVIDGNLITCRDSEALPDLGKALLAGLALQPG
jgi:protease I